MTRNSVKDGNDKGRKGSSSRSAMNREDRQFMKDKVNEKVIKCLHPRCRNFETLYSTLGLMEHLPIHFGIALFQCNVCNKQLHSTHAAHSHSYKSQKCTKNGVRPSSQSSYSCRMTDWSSKTVEEGMLRVAFYFDLCIREHYLELLENTLNMRMNQTKQREAVLTEFPIPPPADPRTYELEELDYGSTVDNYNNSGKESQKAGEDNQNIEKSGTDRLKNDRMSSDDDSTSNKKIQIEASPARSIEQDATGMMTPPRNLNDEGERRNPCSMRPGTPRPALGKVAFRSGPPPKRRESPKDRESRADAEKRTEKRRSSTPSRRHRKDSDHRRSRERSRSVERRRRQSESVLDRHTTNRASTTDSSTAIDAPVSAVDFAYHSVDTNIPVVTGQAIPNVYTTQTLANLAANAQAAEYLHPPSANMLCAMDYGTSGDYCSSNGYQANWNNQAYGQGNGFMPYNQYNAYDGHNYSQSHDGNMLYAQQPQHVPSYIRNPPIRRPSESQPQMTWGNPTQQVFLQDFSVPPPVAPFSETPATIYPPEHIPIPPPIVATNGGNQRPDTPTDRTLLDMQISPPPCPPDLEAADSKAGVKKVLQVQVKSSTSSTNVAEENATPPVGNASVSPPAVKQSISTIELKPDITNNGITDATIEDTNRDNEGGAIATEVGDELQHEMDEGTTEAQAVSFTEKPLTPPVQQHIVEEAELEDVAGTSRKRRESIEEIDLEDDLDDEDPDRLVIVEDEQVQMRSEGVKDKKHRDHVKEKQGGEERQREKKKHRHKHVDEDDTRKEKKRKKEKMRGINQEEPKEKKKKHEKMIEVDGQCKEKEQKLEKMEAAEDQRKKEQKMLKEAGAGTEERNKEQKKDLGPYGIRMKPVSPEDPLKRHKIRLKIVRINSNEMEVQESTSDVKPKISEDANVSIPSINPNMTDTNLEESDGYEESDHEDYDCTGNTAQQIFYPRPAAPKKLYQVIDDDYFEKLQKLLLKDIKHKKMDKLRVALNKRKEARREKKRERVNSSLSDGKVKKKKRDRMNETHS